MHHSPRTRPHRCLRSRVSALVLAGALILTPAPASADNAAATPPAQPASGPGGSAYPHAGFSVASGGRGANAWYVFAPTGPTLTRAPVTIILHGYGDFSGYAMHKALIEHTVRQGTIETWDAQRGCALTATWCDYLDDTAQQRDMGAWSDRTPVTPLTIADTPITS
ncbi:hypothetical protein [Streptosporangium roseum]|uniref:hypothetical protein n=1 Tax=Streptosporangium roseum TaxID=2001 RepID=UPI00332FB5EB